MLLEWDIITHPCLNLNGGFDKPPLNMWHGWAITSLIQQQMLSFIQALAHSRSSPVFWMITKNTWPDYWYIVNQKHFYYMCWYISKHMNTLECLSKAGHSQDIHGIHQVTNNKIGIWHGRTFQIWVVCQAAYLLGNHLRENTKRSVMLFCVRVACIVAIKYLRNIHVGYAWCQLLPRWHQQRFVAIQMYSAFVSLINWWDNQST